MTNIEANTLTAVPSVSPCNFRSAAQLSNESARALTMLHEALARNLMNSLDVYLGTGLEVRLVRVEQLAMEEFKSQRKLVGYNLSCAFRPSTSSVLLEVENMLVFTIIDLLLGGSGAQTESSRELTEIDEEIMEGVGTLIAQQIEKVWELPGSSLVPDKCVKATLAHKLFPPTEKIVRIQLDVTVAGVSGAVHINLQTSLAGALVRNNRAEHVGSKGHQRRVPMLSLRERLLGCRFAVSGELTDIRVPVKSLSKLSKGDILPLVLPVNTPGTLLLEGIRYFEASLVRQGTNKALQLGRRVPAADLETTALGKGYRAE